MMAEYVRPPAVAGQFYAGSAQQLVQEIEGCYRHRLGPGELPQVDEAGPRQIVGLVSPHAGYMYSGPTAACGFYELGRDGRPEVIVIIGPAHRYRVSGAPIQTAGAWATPLGQTPIDSPTASALLEACPVLSEATREFEYEYSLEVQLPFLQHLYGERLDIVPVMMLDQDRETARDIGAAIAEVCREQDVVVVASTDMTHQEPAELAREQDMRLVAHMEELDAQGLLGGRAQYGISMCGYGPTAAMLVAAQALGAQQGELIAYSNSGDVQPMATVIGYVSLKVTR